jgi:predicted phage terminase large subunit-like protein
MTATQQYSASLKRQTVKQFLTTAKTKGSSAYIGNIAELPFGRPTTLQAQIYAERKRFNVLCLGRRCGKTRFGQMLTAETAMQGKPSAWVSPTYKMLSDVWREMKLALYPFIASVNVQEKRIVLKSGGVIDFWSADSVDAIRGRKYARIFVDEAAMVRHLQKAWEQVLRPTLMDYEGDCWFGSTPKGMNYFHTLFTKSQNEEQWKSWQYPTTANPHIKPEEIEAAKRELPEIVFMQEHDAHFVEMGGTAVKREHIQYGNPPSLESLTITMGVDLAISTKTKSDYTAAVVIGRDEEGNVYVLDAKRIRAEFQGVLAFISAMSEAWQPREIAIENVQYQASVIQELRRTTALPIRAVRPDKDKLTRFMPLQSRYEQKLVFHAERIGKDFENELLAFPVGAHDDMIDAAAYAFAAQNKKRVGILTFDD